jgi:hypothetical protein
MELLIGPACRLAGRDHRTEAGARHRIDRHRGLAQGPDHPKVREPARAATGQHQVDRTSERDPRDPRQIPRVEHVVDAGPASARKPAAAVTWRAGAVAHHDDVLGPESGGWRHAAQFGIRRGLVAIAAEIGQHVRVLPHQRVPGGLAALAQQEHMAVRAVEPMPAVGIEGHAVAPVDRDRRAVQRHCAVHRAGHRGEVDAIVLREQREDPRPRVAHRCFRHLGALDRIGRERPPHVRARGTKALEGIAVDREHLALT